MEGLKAVFRIDLVEEKSSLIIDINDSKLNCYRGTVEQADVTAKVKTAAFKQVLMAQKLSRVHLCPASYRHREISKSCAILTPFSGFRIYNMEEMKDECG